MPERPKLESKQLNHQAILAEGLRILIGNVVFQRLARLEQDAIIAKVEIADKSPESLRRTSEIMENLIKDMDQNNFEWAISQLKNM